MTFGRVLYTCFDGNFGLKRMDRAKDVSTTLKREKSFFTLDAKFDEFCEKNDRTKQVESECGQHFTAAKQSRKKKKNVDVSGVFAAVCARHGTPLRGLNIRGTGERMIYALQILDWHIHQWGDSGIKALYDINCVFKKYVEVNKKEIRRSIYVKNAKINFISFSFFTENAYC